MMTVSRHGILRLLLAAGMLLATPFTFAARSLAQEIAPGATGLVANTGGEPVWLRDAPDWNATTLASYVEGTPLQIAEGPLYDASGSAWLGIVIDGAFGYIPATSLVADSAPAAQPVDGAPELAAAPAPEQALPGSTASFATADLNFHVDPSSDSATLWVIPAGTPLAPTGDWVDAFAGVVVDGQFGWIGADWMTRGPVELQQTAGTTPTGGAPGTAMALQATALLAGPEETSGIITSIPAVSEVQLTGQAQDGYLEVSLNGQTGWADAAYLQIADNSDSAQLMQGSNPSQAPQAAPATKPVSCPNNVLDNCYSKTQMKEFAGVANSFVLDYIKAIGVPDSALPKVTYIPSGKQTASKCTDGKGNHAQADDAYAYCPVDNTVYLGQETLWEFYHGFGAVSPIVGLAHEYGHFLQEYTGVPSPRTNKQSITHENQADCVAGSFTNYLDQQGNLEPRKDLLNIGRLLQAIGSKEGPNRDHGTPSQRDDAFGKGFTGKLAACNSFYPSSPIAES